MNKKQIIMKRIKEDYDLLISEGYEVVGVFLQGSQNYMLDYEDSDIDTKAIIVPKFNNFVMKNKPVSTTKILPSTEHIDIKDIRLMFDCFKKQNINFIEILFTDYKLINPKYEELFQPMFDYNEDIARYNNYAAIKCMSGMVMEKFKAIEHPYPATVDKIEKYGYDPKQLHHILRLNEFINRYIKGESYKNCLISNETEFLIGVKKGNVFNLEDARESAEIWNSVVKATKNKYMEDNELKINKKAEEVINNTLLSIMKFSFKSEILEE
jgi:predicted nucleotidyltransferase